MTASVGRSARERSPFEAMSARPLRLKDLMPVLRAITDDDDSITPNKRSAQPSFRVPMKAATPRANQNLATPLRLRRRPPSAKKTKRSERCLFTPEKEHDSVIEQKLDNSVGSLPHKFPKNRLPQFHLPEPCEKSTTAHVANVSSNAILKEHRSTSSAFDGSLEDERFEKYTTPQNEKRPSKKVRTPLFPINNAPVCGSILDYMDKYMDKKLNFTNDKENDPFTNSCHAVKDQSSSCSSETRSSECTDSNFTLPQKSDESIQQSQISIEKSGNDAVRSSSAETNCTELQTCVERSGSESMQRLHTSAERSDNESMQRSQMCVERSGNESIRSSFAESNSILGCSSKPINTLTSTVEENHLQEVRSESVLSSGMKSSMYNNSYVTIPQKSDRSQQSMLQTSIETIGNESIPTALGCVFKPTETAGIKHEQSKPQHMRTDSPLNKCEIKQSAVLSERESSTLKNTALREKQNEPEKCAHNFSESQTCVNAVMPQKRYNENQRSETVATDASNKQSLISNMVLKSMEKNQSTSMSMDLNNQLVNGSMNSSSGSLCQEPKPVLPSFRQYRMMNIKGKYYTVLGKLGHGGSSEVFKVMDPETSKMLAVKCVNLAVDPLTAKGYVNEIKLLQRLQGSDRVIIMYDYEYVKPEKKLYVILEMGDVDLSSLLKYYRFQNKSLPYPIMIGYWTEMLTAVNHIHKNGIIHSDLKPANFLLVHGRLKLIDFGIASSLNGDATSIMKNSTTGTFNYISPEAISMNGINSKISCKSDVWSLGCILYSMLYGYTPFHHIKTLYGKIAALSNPNPMIHYPPLEGIPPVLMKALQSCLTFDMRKRPTVQELIDLPYINTYNDIVNSSTTNENIPISTLAKIKSVLTDDEWLQILKRLNLNQK